ncbi:uncharacterized protein B0H18DRAFT_935321 [Fomitopsis serialis]|uniref:uncharacterized protein n=1 Tax=Fomitopsis serialis TaxID=139415 RepID=UPI0020081D83|nr:uncharacterized protein B0H18DRAFT_935321 [Neoantrodia serialis]KAH9922522.1 hypothetical protein B0H18DRAFT_935321 [Neoantrodia serialis]
MASQYHPSEWEAAAYYHGVSVDPPELLYRSNYLDNPFPRPTGRFQHRPIKTVHGVFNTPLNPVWHAVAPRIRDILKVRQIRYSAIHAARFVTHGEDGQESLSPVVIWIATHPNSTTAEDAHLASPDILSLLEANGVHGAVVEWFEGAVERLSGPALLRVTSGVDPTHYVRRFLTAGLGMPIATAEREVDDAQGSVAFFFHENKDRHGRDSARVLAVSNCHVLRKNTTVPYQFEGAGAPPQHVRLAGSRCFQRGLKKIDTAIDEHRDNANMLAQNIVDDTDAAQRVRLAEKDTAALEDFKEDVNAQWGDITRRNIGHVDWAPEISVDVGGSGYTNLKDIGTFEVDPERFRAQFRGNVVDLGAILRSQQLNAKFYPQINGRTAFEFPFDRQLRIDGWLTRELANPDTSDSNNEACIVVMKDGNTSDLTVGRFAGLEAYTCDELGVESVELAVYNYGKQSGDFSAQRHRCTRVCMRFLGDSGSLIFDGKGKMVGILHSGLATRKGESHHVTYATPAWWAIEQLKAQYPHAEFSRDRF